jgi:hypothetical protein
MVTRQVNKTTTIEDLADLRNTGVSNKVYEAAVKWVDLNSKFDDTWRRMMFNNHYEKFRKEGLSPLDAKKKANDIIPETMDAFFPKVVIPKQAVDLTKIKGVSSRGVRKIKERKPATESEVLEPKYEILTGPNTEFNIVDKTSETGFSTVKFIDLPPKIKDEIHKKALSDWARKESQRALTDEQRLAMRDWYQRGPHWSDPLSEIFRLQDNFMDGWKSSILSGSFGFARNTLWDNVSKSATEFGFIRSAKDATRIFSAFSKDYKKIMTGDFSEPFKDEMIHKAIRSGAVSLGRLDEVHNTIRRQNELMKSLYEKQDSSVGKYLLGEKTPADTFLGKTNNWLEDRKKIYRRMINLNNIYGIGSLAARGENVFRMSAFRTFYKEATKGPQYKQVLAERGKIAAEDWAEKQAASATNDVYFDYSKTGYLHDHLAKRILPFASFQRFNAVYHNAAFSDPRRVSQIMRMMQARSRTGADPEEEGIHLAGYQKATWSRVKGETDRGHDINTLPSQGYGEYANFYPGLANDPLVKNIFERNILPIFDRVISQTTPLVRDTVSFTTGRDPFTGMGVYPSDYKKGRAYIGSNAAYMILQENMINEMARSSEMEPSEFIQRDPETGVVYATDDWAMAYDKAMFYGLPLLYAGIANKLLPPFLHPLAAKVGAATIMQQMMHRSIFGGAGDIRSEKIPLGQAIENAIGPIQIRIHPMLREEMWYEDMEKQYEKEEEQKIWQQERIERDQMDQSFNAPLDYRREPVSR